eukprot:4436982-Pyramimonas_sp.AAC.1
MNFDDRVERCLEELGNQHWDVLVFVETWREQKVESWDTKRGHRWFGSGGTRRSRGVAFLLHQRWVHESFQPLSDRAATLDIQINSFGVIRVAA